ncbi:MAG: type II toxin-antitoxin system RelE/ParE family toxin [Alcanivoracaceae bacterium]|jgi:hypothetical protein|nr:type II toxin-antitoxin system RelE/ParE family toxin [Alcanivoracaceae bacterium]
MGTNIGREEIYVLKTILPESHNMPNSWTVIFHDLFAKEFDRLEDAVQDELLAHALLLGQFGPSLGRPAVDTLKGCRHSNLKELRFRVNRQVWRVAFAFDPARQAILLVAGNKAGANQQAFYRRLIAAAEARYSQHLQENS